MYRQSNLLTENSNSSSNLKKRGINVKLTALGTDFKDKVNT